MTRDQAKEYLKSRLTEYVQSITKPSCGENMYVCPLCGSGEGKHKTGAFSVYDNGQKWKCFSCGNGGDLFELIGLTEHIGDFKNRMDRAAEIFHITLDSNDEYKKGLMTMARTDIKKTENVTTDKDESTVDYTEKFKQAQDWLFNGEDKQGLEYLHKRGISVETAKKYGLGFVPGWRHPKAPKTVPLSPRIIIPSGKEGYMARDIRENLTGEAAKHVKMNVGKQHMLNTEALYNSDKPVYIVEGQFDMLSIIEVGGNAVALCTTGKVREFLSLVGKKAPIQPLIIALDNDKTHGGNAGEKAAAQLTDGLAKLGIPYVKYNVSGKYKDPNEALVADREEFTATVLRGNDIDSLRDETETAEKEEYMQNSALSHLQEFLYGIGESANTPNIPTGFANLDKVLDGGFYEGLYVLGGSTSLGKTTFAMQICDNVAINGFDALVFSLEMSRTELMAKSISRISYDTVIKNGYETRLAKTIRGITDGKRYSSYCQEEMDLINNSIKEYGKYAGHIFITEGIGNISTDSIRETVKRHINYTGRKPVVFVDYLQIIAPCKDYDRSTDKQIIDKAVLELKRISRDFKIPVIVISSFGRASYKKEAEMESFKESGGIEYSCDVLLGLQSEGAGERGFNYTAAKDGDTRSIELKVLKNRNGKVNQTLKFSYYPAFNLVREGD